MSCYRKGSRHGPYENTYCSMCPASKPEYAKRYAGKPNPEHAEKQSDQLKRMLSISEQLSRILNNAPDPELQISEETEAYNAIEMAIHAIGQFRRAVCEKKET